jgi:hypothetical protein
MGRESNRIAGIAGELVRGKRGSKQSLNPEQEMGKFTIVLICAKK